MLYPWPLEAEASHTVEDLSIWYQPCPKCKHGVPPSEGGISNPVLVDGAVVGSVFSPGILQACDAESGELLWRKRFSSLASGDPAIAGDLVLLHDSNYLVAFEPKSGKERWRVQPTGNLETIWVSGAPRVFGDTVLVVDTAGKVYAYRYADGSLRWSAQTSRRRRPRINGQPWTDGKTVIVGGNAGLVTSSELDSGQRIWQRRLQGPVWTLGESVDGLAGIVGWNDLYGLCPTTGRVLHRWNDRGRHIRATCVGAGGIYVALEDPEYRPVDGDHGMKYQPQSLAMLRGWKVQWEIPYPPFPMTDLIWSSATGKLYETTQSGLGIIDPERGVRDHAISDFPHKDGLPTDKSTPPLVTPDRIYTIAWDGAMHCLRHP